MVADLRPKATFLLICTSLSNDAEALLPFAQAFQLYLADGLGATRGRVDLMSINLLDGSRRPSAIVFSDGRMREEPHSVMNLELSADPPGASDVRLNSPRRPSLNTKERWSSVPSSSSLWPGSETASVRFLLFTVQDHWTSITAG